MEKPWNVTYGNSKSAQYKTLKSELENHLRGILEKKYGQNLLDLEVKNFRNGSIIFDFTVFLTSTTDVDANSLKKVIEKGEGGSANFTISVESVKQVAGPTQTTTFPTCPTCPEPVSCKAWIAVVIALGIINLLLFVLLLCFILQNRRSKNSSKKWNTSDRQNYNDSFAQPRMYSVVSTDMYPLTGTPRVARKTNSVGLTTFSAENEGCNGLENEDKEAEPNSNKPLQDDNKSDVPEKEDKDEGNLQSLSGISFY